MPEALVSVELLGLHHLCAQHPELERVPFADQVGLVGARVLTVANLMACAMIGRVADRRIADVALRDLAPLEAAMRRQRLREWRTARDAGRHVLDLHQCVGVALLRGHDPFVDADVVFREAN